MLFFRLSVLIVLIFSSVSCTTPPRNPPPTASFVDVDKYAGRWYEIARLPMPFQKVGDAAIAEYGKKPDGTLSVYNRAIRPDGSEASIKGYAKILNPGENTKLAVKFSKWFSIFIPNPKEGNYWIFHTDKDYQEAIVGTPSRQSLWILARTERIPKEQLDRLIEMAAKLGFDTSPLIISPRQSAKP